MKKFEISRFWYLVIVTCIILLSYVHFSVIYHPFLDIYSAITVLMTPGYSIPGDLYFWGQNFSGSFIPFLAQLLHLTYRFPPAMAVAVIHYLVLIGGFLALSSLFKSRYYKIVLSVLWFFPVWHAQAHLTGVFGLQLSFIVTAVFLINKYNSTFQETTKQIWLAAIGLTFVIAIWVSDLSYVSLILLLSQITYNHWGTVKQGAFGNFLRSKQGRITLIIVLFWTLFGIFFLWYGKAHAATAFSLYSPLFASPSEIMQSMGILFSSLFNILLFKSGNTFESLYTWGALTLVPWILLTSKLNDPNSENGNRRQWMVYFWLAFFALLLTTLASKWVAINGTDRRYFSIVWLTFCVALLLFSELSDNPRAMLRKRVLLGFFLLGGFSSLYPSYFPSHLEARIDTMNGIRTLGNIGIIAESEVAYLMSCSDPGHVKATPHDKEYIRNFNLAQDVLKQEKIYLVKGGWLKAFPDTVVQFTILLQRTGVPFIKAGYELCRYEKIVKRRVFSLGEMKYQGKVVEDTNAFSTKTAMITPEFDRGKHFIYGPFVDLPKGKYTVVFRLMTSRDLAVDNVAVLDVSANFGKEIVASKTIRLCDFSRSHHFEEFEVSFETAKDYTGVEFRIMFLGGVDLSFDRILLLEKQN